MFGRKRRVPSNPALHNGVKVNSSAQAAATAVFLNNQASNASLSAAAAAAALRAWPTTPTSVADVQTKRTMRRTNSTSSIGSSVAGVTRGPLGSKPERRGSSGSMTERTFRDPSPNRGPSQPNVNDAPPVPTIPKNIAPPVPPKSHRRAASAESPASRIASPLPNQATGRGSSLEPVHGIGAPRDSAHRLSNLASVQELTGLERPDSGGSVNFSYPTGARETSPYGQRRLTSPTPSSNERLLYTQKQNVVYDPNTRSFLPESEILFYERSIRDVADRPVKRKKKVALHGAAGTHLSDGTVRGRTKGTAVDAIVAASSSLQRIEAYDEPARPSAINAPAPRRKKKIIMSDTDSERDSYTASASEYDSDTSEKHTKFNTRAGMLLTKKPSVVREEREREEAEDDAKKVLDRQAALSQLETGSPEARAGSPSPLPPSAATKGHGHERASASMVYTESQQQTRSASQPAPSLILDTAPTSTSEFPSSEPIGRGGGSIRVASLSPVRTTHFLTAPENSGVRHQPPPRSISPRKSALKHSPSSRGTSPIGDVLGKFGTAHGPSLSEASDTSTALSDERALPRKKSVRVSFDDENNIVLNQPNATAASDSPISQSPPSKRGWFSSIGRGQKKDLSSMGDDDDEIMKPRPALPSFGSVREKKTRDVDERPLVRPAESAEQIRTLPSPLSTAATGEAIALPMGQSHDHAIGAVIAQDQASRNAANISKSLEPLPPEVTSVEGSGYVSDSSSSSYSVKASDPTTERPESLKPDLEDVRVDTYRTLASLQANDRNESDTPVVKTNGNGTIPTLALTEASPIIEETEDDNDWPNIPGGFPDSSDSGLDDSQISIAEPHLKDITPASLGISEPEPIVYHVGSPAVGDLAPENLHRHAAIGEETEESDHSSIYSDAAEDLSDTEGDGFMSLDAVVDSPIVPSFPSLALTTPQDSPTSKENTPKSRFSKNSSEPEPDKGWDKAQQHYTVPTAEKKKEMERALSEGADDDSSEEEMIPAPKLEKGKKVVMESPPRNVQVDKPQLEPKHHRTYQIPPGAKAAPDGPVLAMRSSMRAEPPNTEDSAHVRKSMRNSGFMRASMREPSESAAPTLQSKASLQKKYRPMSHPPAEIKPNPIEVKKHFKTLPVDAPSVPTPKIQAAPRPAPTLRRRGSAESDSSFKRARPVKEGYNMRRSMRGSQQEHVQARPQSPNLPTSPIRSGRFTLRSLSPSESRAAPPVSVGWTMRGIRKFSNELNTPTLRSTTADSVRSPLRIPGFGKSNLSPKAKVSPTRASRFADSSDDEDIRPSFRSRFVDSSDEEDAPLSRPMPNPRSDVVGIARHAGTIDDDFSGLSDTDNERSPPPIAANVMATNDSNALVSGSLRRSGSGRGFTGITTTSITAGAALGPTRNRHGSFMSILRRKKPDPSSKVRKSDAESAARRDTPLERSRADLKAVKRQDSSFSTASMGANPKLQKLKALKRAGTVEDWPLASPHPDVTGAGLDLKRSSTADDQGVNGDVNGNGTVVPGRPDLGAGQSTATGLADIDLSAVTPPRKKKKFGMLRRAFGLDD